MTALKPDQVAERLEIVRSALPPRDLDLRGVWWCPGCRRSIGGSHVTFDEHCEFCGTHLSNVQPDLEAVLAAHDALDALDADRRSQAERIGKLEGALADVLPYAERGAYLSEKCAFEYGDGYTQPYELTISWEWQQSKPYTGGWGALRSDTEAWVSELRESEADVAVVRARSALERQQ